MRQAFLLFGNYLKFQGDAMKSKAGELTKYISGIIAARWIKRVEGAKGDAGKIHDKSVKKHNR